MFSTRRDSRWEGVHCLTLYPSVTSLNHVIGSNIVVVMPRRGLCIKLRKWCLWLYSTFLKIISASQKLRYSHLLLLKSGDIEINPGPTHSRDMHDTDLDLSNRNHKKSLVLNCGFARTAVYELSHISAGTKRYVIDKTSRYQQFLKLFKHCCIPVLFGSMRPWKDGTYFDLCCDRCVLDVVGMGKWKDKEKYLETFATSKWERMSIAERKKHTVSKCVACYVNYSEFQLSYPLKPVFVPDLNIKQHLMSARSASVAANSILRDLNGVFQANFNKSFVEMSSDIVKTAKSSSSYILKRKISLEMKKTVESSLRENMAIVHLAECESDASYSRKRKVSCFQAAPAKRSQTFKVTPEKEAEIVSYLKDCEGPVVWSTVAKSYQILATNGGHIVKQLAIRAGLDVETLQGKKEKSFTVSRVHKKKTSDHHVSMPCLPSLAEIKSDINSLIDSGKLNLGEPCAPYSIFQFKWNNGTLEKQESQVFGRKLNLHCLRQKLLNKHEPFMRLNTNDVIEDMTTDDLVKQVSQFERVSEVNSEYLKVRMKTLQRTRHLLLWHDHSSVLSRGYILVTLSVVFDEAVFDVTLYDERKHGITFQEFIEQPELYLVCLSSSSIDDQAALVPDRLECLSSLSEDIKCSNGVYVHDVLRFFIGDHKAVAFEQGTQCGGHYPCGCCGIQSEKHSDQSHALHKKVRSLQDLQNLAIGGIHGHRSNIVKPFEGLSVGNLQNELRARGCVEIDLPKVDLIRKLKEMLEGCQRVPSLLLGNPTCNLSQYNLEHYSILPCEPLHDLKGHLNNVLPAISNLLTGTLKSEVNDVIQKTVYWKDSGHTGADMRVGLLRVYRVILQAVNNGTLANNDVLMLVQSAVCISEILYLPSSDRSPRKILKLYNACWLHHELCVSLFHH